jgi:predicted SprT family Zn-dependent metalloprotease
LNKIEAAEARTIELLDKYGITGWTVYTTNSRKTLAVTDHDTKIVELSKRFVMLATREQFDGIIRHEVAHILAGPGRSHGKEFVEKCNEIGAGEAFSCDNYPIHIKLYKYLCEFCGVVEYNNAKKDLVCGKCMLAKAEFVNLERVTNKIEVMAW